ncbi:asparagine synthase [Fonticella tunisiensis]|uniref:Asparagine synthase n=1 Tax=Fonticella tunisiensis TaxID=1096341 RepID=A0A4R7KAS1_9CLOT|nr:asparagine synthase [Fonticella tunisiensis]TDT51964.1 hypothetical protein EDD71_11651 [Fonticella tunisiensis]
MVREGLIPTVLGTAVAATGAVLRGMDTGKRRMRRRDIMPMVEAGIIGFGLAHVVLGAIDLIQNRR